jgi:hypothetical protein
MNEKCKDCYYYHEFLGAEYCGYDNNDEIICTRFLSKNAQLKYLKKEQEKALELEIWEDLTEEELEYYDGCTPQEIYLIKRDRKKSLKQNSEFIKKYPAINPDPPKRI